MQLHDCYLVLPVCYNKWFAFIWNIIHAKLLVIWQYPIICKNVCRDPWFGDTSHVWMNKPDKVAYRENVMWQGPNYESVKWGEMFNTLRLRQDGRHFPDDIFKCIFLNKNVSISIKISLKFVPKGPINNIPALVQIMAWRRPGDKPLSETMMVNLLTHICFTLGLNELTTAIVIEGNYAACSQDIDFYAQ